MEDSFMKTFLKMTLKQSGFAKDYLRTFNASLSARNNYNVKNGRSSKVIGSRLMKHPKVLAFWREATKGYIDKDKVKAVVTDALKANRVYIRNGKHFCSDVPDHKVRIKAARLAIRYPCIIV